MLQPTSSGVRQHPTAQPPRRIGSACHQCPLCRLSYCAAWHLLVVGLGERHLRRHAQERTRLPCISARTTMSAPPARALSATAERPGSAAQITCKPSPCGTMDQSADGGSRPGHLSGCALGCPLASAAGVAAAAGRQRRCCRASARGCAPCCMDEEKRRFQRAAGPPSV